MLYLDQIYIYHNLSKLLVIDLLLVIRDFENFLQFARYIEDDFVRAKLAKSRVLAIINIINHNQ